VTNCSGGIVFSASRRSPSVVLFMVDIMRPTDQAGIDEHQRGLGGQQKAVSPASAAMAASRAPH
jgi:hypothetical protein